MNLSDPSTISEIKLLEGERVDDLQYNGMKIIQKTNAFRFGTDAVLLSDFALIRKNDRVADLGTGTGAIALLIAAHHEYAQVDAIEIQEDMAEMAQRSVRLNHIADRVRVHPMDLRCAAENLGYGKFDQVVCNPPYSKEGAALQSVSLNKRLSRHEGDTTIGEICLSAAALLKTGGRFSVVFPAQRAFEMMCEMKKANLAPKRIRCVQGTKNHAPRLILIDSVKNGGEQLHWLPPLILRNEDGSETEEWFRIYGRA
ncbi:MAG: tRNA1(Val) (adenine(37)-N6)-methyltransferase [Clostridia bacterium]|nr:tRNA1(Val) (adenine(37)-N6)-methyltransferase [Clostridiales bacterium]MBQ3231645.1 tRNA1(Val) (adenine(37)-N6)-methyltransferase [Clostridia bacterium]